MQEIPSKSTALACCVEMLIAILFGEHGEVTLVSVSDSDHGIDTDSNESMQGNMEIEMNSDVELDFGEDQEPLDECNEFQQLVEEANIPLYPGCKSHTKFNALLRLQNHKAKHHMSDAAYSDWVELIGNFLPEGNEIPNTYSGAKKSLLSKLRMDYEKIHACPNECISYIRKHAKAVVCPTEGREKQ
ncbi:hypothetical protein ACLB2K_029575 [Fragaria x ananassa]